MAFSPAFLDELRGRLPVSELVGKRVRLTKRGREHMGLCPFHNEKTPSFTVNDDKGFFHCFGCGAHGDVVGFAMRAEGLSFPEAVERLAGLAGLEVPRAGPAEREREERRKTLHTAVEAACVWFEAQLRAPAGAAAREYLARRGLDADTVARFRLGFAPEGRSALKAALMREGYNEALLVEAGLLSQPEGGGPSFDFLRGRVVFPIADRQGRVVAFGGRVLGDGQPKYLNSRDTPLFDKGRTLFALDKAREGLRRGAEAIVAEGYMDAIALHAAGFAGAVAPLGTALTEAQIEILWRMAAEPILCFDGDAAGRRAALRAAERALPMLRPGLSLRFVDLPAGEDPDTFLRRQGPAAFTQAMARAAPISEVVWQAETAGQAIETPEKRAAVEGRLRARIAAIADRTVRNAFEQDLIWKRLRGRRADRTAPPLGLKAAGETGILAQRQAQALLAALLSHPDLARSESESLTAIDLDWPDLEAFRRELLNAVLASADLDSATLAVQLERVGWASTLADIRSPAVYRLVPFAHPDSPLDEARAGVRHLLAMFARQRLAQEVAVAGQALGVEMTEAGQGRVAALRGQFGPPEFDDSDGPAARAGE